MPESERVVDDEEGRPAHVCVVYDPGSGRVVHVHEFYGEGFKPDECARTALDTVASLRLVKTAGLKVLHRPELTLKPDTMLRVDPASLEIVTKTQPRRPRRPGR